MLSRLHSLSGYDILVQLGVEIMTVYRMKLFFMCHLIPGCDILMSGQDRTGYSYIILKSLHYTGNVRI